MRQTIARAYINSTSFHLSSDRSIIESTVEIMRLLADFARQAAMSLLSEVGVEVSRRHRSGNGATKRALALVEFGRVLDALPHDASANKLSVLFTMTRIWRDAYHMQTDMMSGPS